MVCPHCGYEDSDSWEFRDNDGECDCGRCGEPFDYERIVTVEYSTTKKRCATHSFKPRTDYPTHDGKNGKYYLCVECEVCQYQTLQECSKEEYALNTIF